MKTIPDMLTTVARQHAQRPALVDGEITVSYTELASRVAILAHELSRLGVRAGDRVALLLPNSVHFVTSYLAIVTVGAIVVPLPEQYQQTELRFFLETCEMTLLITSQGYTQLVQSVLWQYQCQVLLIEHCSAVAAAQDSIALDPDTPVMYQFSSGSTGQPKRIARTHTQLLSELQSLTHTLAIVPTDRLLGVAPFAHVNGLMRSMLASIYAGATLYPVAKFERQAVADTIEKHRISLFIAVPFMFAMLARAHWRRQPDFSSLRLCVSASAPLPAPLSRQFYQCFGIYVRQLYGSTETGTISINLDADVTHTLDSVGTPIDDVTVEIFTEDGYSAGQDAIGEVAVSSPAAIRGYVDSDDAHAAAFRHGYFLTGDLGRRDRDGRLYLLGRKKFFINKGGYKINPYEIETFLEGHPQVEEAAVIGVPTPYGDEKVKAVLVVRPPCTEADIMAYCHGQLAAFKIPSLIEFCQSLPKSSTGKLRKSLLR